MKKRPKLQILLSEELQLERLKHFKELLTSFREQNIYSTTAIYLTYQIENSFQQIVTENK